MPIRPNQVLKLARLARLGYSDQELDEFVPRFREIIGYVDQLEELPTEGVEPLYHALRAEERQEGTRPDQVRPSLSGKAALQNAPRTEEGQFRVPKVIE